MRDRMFKKIIIGVTAVVLVLFLMSGSFVVGFFASNYFREARLQQYSASSSDEFSQGPQGLRLKPQAGSRKAET